MSLEAEQEVEIKHFLSQSSSGMSRPFAFLVTLRSLGRMQGISHDLRARNIYSRLVDMCALPGSSALFSLGVFLCSPPLTHSTLPLLRIHLLPSLLLLFPLPLFKTVSMSSLLTF